MLVGITGATGHIGTVLIEHLKREGHQIRVLSRKPAGISGVEEVPGDVLSRESLYTLMQGCEIVFHLAAIISVNGDPYGVVARTNIEGTRNVTEVAKDVGIRRLIATSSIHAYEQRPSLAELNETSPAVSGKGAAYDQSKREMQQVLLAANDAMEVLVANPTGVIGPPDPRPSLMGKAIIDISMGRIPAIFDGGFDFVDVRDVVHGLVSLMDKGTPGQNYLLSGRYYSIHEFIAEIGEASGRKIKIPVIPIWVARTGLPFVQLAARMKKAEPLFTRESIDALAYGNQKISHEKAKAALNFNPRGLKETLNDLIPWFKSQGRIS